MGPAIENGFYYDFDLGGEGLASENLKEIETKMKKIIGGGVKFERREIGTGEAQKIFADQPYKLEIINGLEAGGEQKVSIYQSGDFCDLCRGPHVESGKDLAIDGFKLTKIAGAYWKGSEKNKMLTRVYAAAFASKNELDEYLKIWKRPKSATIENWARKWDCSCSRNWLGRDCRYIPRKARRCARKS